MEATASNGLHAWNLTICDQAREVWTAAVVEDDGVTIRFKAVTTFHDDAATDVTDVKLTRKLEGEWRWIVAEAWWLDDGWSRLKAPFFKALHDISGSDNDLGALKESEEEAVASPTCHRRADIKAECLVSAVRIISLRGIETGLQDVCDRSARHLLEVIIDGWEEG